MRVEGALFELVFFFAAHLPEKPNTREICNEKLENTRAKADELLGKEKVSVETWLAAVGSVIA